MKIVFPLLKEPIELQREDKVSILVIENQKFFVEFLSDIYSQTCGNNGEAVLSENNEPVSIAKRLELLTSFVPFETNKKSLLTKLYKMAEEISVGEDLLLKTQEIIRINLEYISTISENLNFPLDFSDEFSISYILKAVDLKFDNCYDSLAEKLIDYMETVNQLEGEKCFVLVNIRNYIDDNEIDAFYKNILYKKFKVLVVGACDYPPSCYENKLIIDKDLCVI